MWYSACGCLTVIVVGLIVSAVTGFQDPRKLNPALICNTGTTIYWFMPKRFKEFMRFHVGDDYVNKIFSTNLSIFRKNDNFIFFPGINNNEFVKFMYSIRTLQNQQWTPTKLRCKAKKIRHSKWKNRKWKMKTIPQWRRYELFTTKITEDFDNHSSEKKSFEVEVEVDLNIYFMPMLCIDTKYNCFS